MPINLDPKVSNIVNRAMQNGYRYIQGTLRREEDHGRYYALEIEGGVVEKVLYDKNDRVVSASRVL